jgi:hypothetical protein
MTPQFERTYQLDFEYRPANEFEFLSIVEKAPMNILKGFGFGLWDSMNNLIAENNDKPKKEVVKIPAINGPDIDFELGAKEVQSEELNEDEHVIVPFGV